jgi:gamma-glutamyltranspeptidase/glutathione hydrolase
MKFHGKHSPFISRRSTVMAPNGAVATSQPLAAQAGLSILQAGGNAVDAAVATAAVLAVVEPMSTGIGGDVFALLYDADTRSLSGLNASGWAPEAADIETYTRHGFQSMPLEGVFANTVPGAVAGWHALLERYGTLSFRDVLQPAITYASTGFPVSERISYAWNHLTPKLQRNPGGDAYLVQGRAPVPGQSFTQRQLASSLELIATHGVDAFYRGTLADQMIRFLQQHGSVMTREDLAEYEPEWVQPLAVHYDDYTLYELPPNGQGLCALEALNIVSHLPLEGLDYQSPEYLHYLIEAMKIAFHDGHQYITDPRFRAIPIDRLLSNSYCREQSTLITDTAQTFSEGALLATDTVYLTIVDKDRNMVSFINSLFNGFGSGVVADGTGIVLQNRGSSFSLDSRHNNSLEPRKRPFHTIIPGMMYRNAEPYMSFGVMGGHMQPQGHLQVALNLIRYEMSPQDALDAPRFRYETGRTVLLEENVPHQTHQALKQMGHTLEIYPRLSSLFGGGQIIIVDAETNTLLAGSEPRKDGCAVGY